METFGKFIKRFRPPQFEKSEEEIEAGIEDRKEKSLEEIQVDERRSVYTKSYTEYRQAFGGMKKKDLAGFEATIKLAREQYIQLGDSEKLKSELEEGKWEAGDRRSAFINELIEKGISVWNVEAIYNAELAKLEYENSKLELGKKMKKEGVADAEIFQELILNERERLNLAKVESWPPKERGIFRKGMEWYMKRGTVTRLLISTGLVTGVVASVGGFGAAAAATFAGYRFVRGFGSVMIGKFAGKGVDWVMSKGITAQKEAALENLKTGFDLNKLAETEKNLEKIFEETAKKEKRKLLIKGAVSIMAGAGTAIGIGMLEHAFAGGVKVAPETIKPKAEIPPEAPPKPIILETPLKPQSEFLEIGNRGPEGSIIDYLKTHPEAAKNFGWDGKANITEWAGRKAHLLWIEEAKEALVKPETIEQLKKLGYSSDTEGYARMMHRIGKGAVEMNSETGKINLVGTEYLKVKITPEVLLDEATKTKIDMSAYTNVPQAESTEHIFSEVSPEIGRRIITEKLYENFHMWSGIYDKFSEVNFQKFLHFSGTDSYRVTGAPWEEYDYSKFSKLQNKIKEVYNALDASEKSTADNSSVDAFIKKYFTKIFEAK